MSSPNSNSTPSPPDLRSFRISIGSRFQIGLFRCTVLYIGPIHTRPPAEDWLGVEWDDPSRGKNNGMVGDRRYFSPRLSPLSATSCSFLKRTKFLQVMKTPITFLKGVSLRYLSATSVTNPDSDSTIIPISDARGRRIEVRLVGLESISQHLSSELSLGTLRKLSLSGMFISSIFGKERTTRTRTTAAADAGTTVVAPAAAGEEEEVEGELLTERERSVGFDDIRRVRELDLSGCLVWDWDEVRRLGSRMLELEILDLSRNRLWLRQRVADECDEQDGESDDDDASPAFGELKVLALNGSMVGVSDGGSESESGSASASVWDVFLKRVVPDIPKVEEIFLNANKIDVLGRAIKSGNVSGNFQHIRKISLLGNSLRDFGDVSRSIGLLETLEDLILSENLFEDLGVGGEKNIFRNLKFFAIARNRLSQLRSSIDCLVQAMPVLQHLICFENPFEQGERDQETVGTAIVVGDEIERGLTSVGKVRTMIIGKLKGLQLLNRSEITRQEREDAEKYYLTKFWPKKAELLPWEKTRLTELSQAYVGLVVTQTEDSPNDKDISSLKVQKVVRVMLECRDRSRRKRLMSAMTVRQLRILCKRLFRITEAHVHLTATISSRRSTEASESEESETMTVDLDDDDMPLSYFGIVRDGSVVNVAPMDELTMQTRRREYREEFERRLEEQEEELFKLLAWQKKRQ